MISMLTIMVAAATTAAPVSVYGIAIDQPLTVPMCAVEPLGDGDLAKYKSNARPKSGACWGHKLENRIGTPLTDGVVYVLFDFWEPMDPMISNRIEVQILGGKVQYLRFETGGLKTQAVDAANLIAKFGKPFKMDRLPLQNGFGAKFEALKVDWNISKIITATFVGWSEDGGNGFFSIGTNAGERAFFTPADVKKPSIPL